MEDLLLHMRCLWFGSRLQVVPGARILHEPEGDIVACLDGTPEEAEAVLAEARRRRAYVIVTPFSRPPDLPARLRSWGFRPVQRQGTYLYPGDRPPVLLPRRRRWLAWWRRVPEVEVRAVDAGLLPEWNRVCYLAFGPRGQTEAESLAEKERAYLAMGNRATWYLAWCGGQPAGTAILYRGEGAAQILAVGTAPGYRRQGVASALVRQAVADALLGRPPGPGPYAIFLDTRPGSVAERVYVRLGFVPAYLRTVYAP